jgi:hypothetical protein
MNVSEVGMRIGLAKETERTAMFKTRGLGTEGEGEIEKDGHRGTKGINGSAGITTSCHGRRFGSFHLRTASFVSGRGCPALVSRPTPYSGRHVVATGSMVDELD